MNCGVCTAICPAAEFYNYDPRKIVDTVQTKDEDKITDLLKSETIWYCGECMSCKTRCPRGNAPGLIIMALRSLSQDLGFFVESEKGRQQLALKRTVGNWMITYGYCLYLEGVGTSMHPEQGPVWDWIQENWSALFKKMGANYKGDGLSLIHISEPTRLLSISYAVFCLKKKTKNVSHTQLPQIKKLEKQNNYRTIE